MQTEEHTAAAFKRQLEHVRTLEFEGAAAYLGAARALATDGRSEEVPALFRLKAQSELGNALRVSGELAEAARVLDEAIAGAGSLPEGADRHALLGLSHLRLAIVHDVGGSTVDAYVNLEHASRSFAETGDEAGLARCDNVRAAIYTRIDDFEEAEKSYLSALEYYRKSGEAERIGVVLTNLVLLYRYMNRPDDAVVVGREAVGLAQSALLKATAVGNLAFAMAETGELDEALQMARETEELMLAIGQPDYLVMFRRAIASILLKKGEAAEALALLQAALSEAHQKGFQESVRDSHGLLAEAYREVGDFEKAYVHLKAYHEHVVSESQKKAASQIEVHRSRLELENVRLQAEREREGRKQLAESLAELSSVHEQLSARAVELEWHSYRDSLTELANRRYFDDRLGSVLKRNLETGDDLSIIVLDLDRFKNVNDSYGHSVGDGVLRAVAGIMEASIRRSDLAARLGGEEFAILLGNAVHPDDLHAKAEKLRKAIMNHDWGKVAPGLRITVSVGTASLSEVGSNPMKLLELADRRLYLAKRAGRNRVASRTERAKK